MALVASSIITGATLMKLVAGAFAAGLGVTLAFSALIYCVERASELRRQTRRAQAIGFQAAAGLASLACLAIVAFGLLEALSKPA